MKLVTHNGNAYIAKYFTVPTNNNSSGVGALGSNLLRFPASIGRGATVAAVSRA